MFLLYLVKMIFLSSLFALFSALAGLYISFHLNIASGAAIVVVATIFFALAFKFSS